MNRGRRIRWTSLRLLAVVSACATSFAADDDVVVDRTNVEANAAAIDDVIEFKAPVIRQRQQLQQRAVQIHLAALNLNDTQFERQIFVQDLTAQRGRWRMNSELDAAINTIERVCDLTDAQKQKLILVGRADRMRFFERLETIQERSRSGQGLTREMQVEIESLRKTAEARSAGTGFVLRQGDSNHVDLRTT